MTTIELHGDSNHASIDCSLANILCYMLNSNNMLMAITPGEYLLNGNYFSMKNLISTTADSSNYPDLLTPVTEGTVTPAIQYNYSNSAFESNLFSVVVADPNAASTLQHFFARFGMYATQWAYACGSPDVTPACATDCSETYTRCYLNETTLNQLGIKFTDPDTTASCIDEAIAGGAMDGLTQITGKMLATEINWSAYPGNYWNRAIYPDRGVDYFSPVEDKLLKSVDNCLNPPHHGSGSGSGSGDNNGLFDTFANASRSIGAIVIILFLTCVCYNLVKQCKKQCSNHQGMFGADSRRSLLGSASAKRAKGKNTGPTFSALADEIGVAPNSPP